MKHVEFGAGLGDTLTLIFNCDSYSSLELLQPDEQALIVLMSHNPCVKEFFLWHPKNSQFIIRDLGFWWPWEDAEKRREHGLPPAPPLVWSKPPALKFYPAPEEFEGIDALKALGNYVVISACAGGVDRNIPQPIAQETIKVATDMGFSVVVIGRNYNLPNRTEYAFPDEPNVINLVDRLSGPATVEVIKNSMAVFCCHSAICLLAWYLRKPVFLLYPSHVKEREFDKPAHQYTFGKDFKTTDHMQVSEYSSERLSRFLSMAANVSLG